VVGDGAAGVLFGLLVIVGHAQRRHALDLVGIRRLSHDRA
jgi:hypothetical protein